MNRRRTILGIIFAFGLFAITMAHVSSVHAQRPACAAPHLIEEQFKNGAAWQLCWEWRPHEGIVLSDVRYQAPNHEMRLVLKEAAPAELQVSYDNGSVYYFDVSAEGLGLNHQDLNSADCPAGIRYQHAISETDTRSVLCRTRHDHGPAYRFGDQTRSLQSVDLFSISRIDVYEYIYRWSFHDDGTIDIAVGATGRLVEYGLGAEGFGWDVDPPVTQGRESLALSHVHTFWFRLDFDIDGPGHDTVEEFNFDPEDDRLRLRMSVDELGTETGRQVAPERMRFWRVKDVRTKNADGNPISYRLMPNSQAMYRGIDAWDWTTNDLYVTKFDACEQWLIANDRPDCKRKVTEYVNGESTLATDVVVWYGSSFHHVPRSEDEEIMPLHWEGFHLVPNDWTAHNPSIADVPLPPEGVSIVVPPASEPLIGSQLDWRLAVSLAAGVLMGVCGTVFVNRRRGLKQLDSAEIN